MVRFKCSESSSVQLRLRTAGLIQISHLTHPQTKCEKAKFLAQKPNKFEAGMGRKAWDRTEVLVSFLLLLQNILTKSNTERERFTWLKLPGRSPYCREGNKEPKAPCSQWSTESEMDSWVHLHSLARSPARSLSPSFPQSPCLGSTTAQQTVAWAFSHQSSVKTVSYWPAETENSYNSLPGNFKAVSNSQLKLTSTEGKKERKRTYWKTVWAGTLLVTVHPPPGPWPQSHQVGPTGCFSSVQGHYHYEQESRVWGGCATPLRPLKHSSWQSQFSKPRSSPAVHPTVHGLNSLCRFLNPVLTFEDSSIISASCLSTDIYTDISMCKDELSMVGAGWRQCILFSVVRKVWKNFQGSSSTTASYS